jgi:quinol-cytochrome oxidoreductase complex cytochrome b subunit
MKTLANNPTPKPRTGIRNVQTPPSPTQQCEGSWPPSGAIKVLLFLFLLLLLLFFFPFFLFFFFPSSSSSSSSSPSPSPPPPYSSYDFLDRTML